MSSASRPSGSAGRGEQGAQHAAQGGLVGWGQRGEEVALDVGPDGGQVVHEFASPGRQVEDATAADRTRAALAGGRPGPVLGGGRAVLSQAAAVNDGYSRTFEVATVLILAAFGAAFGAAFVVPAIRARTAAAPAARAQNEAKTDADAAT
jgi:hypothetical protein